MRALGVMLLALVAGPSSAAEREASVMDAISGAKLQALMQEWGYRSELTILDDGDPRIASRNRAFGFYVDFYECDDAEERACKSLQMSAGLDMQEPLDFEIVNQWNRDYRYGSAYLDEEGDPYLQMSINIDGGTTVEALKQYFEWWDVTSGNFARYLDW